MTNKYLKEQLTYLIQDEDDLNRIAVLEGDEFADGCVGVTLDNHLVYSYDKLIESLSKNMKCSVEDAAEYLDYNTIPALPYITNRGLLEPIIIRELDH